MKLDIDVRRRTSDYDFSKRQSIEIARARLVPRDVLSISAPLVLLDEPTSALEKSEEDALFQADSQHQGTRVGSLCVPSSWRGVERLDIVHVLKDGCLVATVSPADVDERTLHGLMVGRERDSDYYHEEEQGLIADHPSMLEVRGLSHADYYKDVSFAIREGEVFGIGGLLDFREIAPRKGYCRSHNT